MDRTRIKSMADTYRIWRYAEMRKWDVTVDELADALDLHPIRVFKLCQSRGWRKQLAKQYRGRDLDSPFRLGRVTLSELSDLIGRC